MTFGMDSMTSPSPSATSVTATSVTATLSQSEVGQRTWDVGVIGAGVAGTSLAIQLAQRGCSVLLIESQRFPREKVCGGCLNQRAMASLQEMGVWSECLAAGAVEIDTLRVRQGTREHRWSIPGMLSMRRSTLDTILVRSAIERGAHFIDQTTATMDASRQIDGECKVLHLRSMRNANVDGATQAGPQDVRVRVAVVAAGLTRSPLAQRDAWPASIETGSRIGVQSLIPAEMLQHDAGPWGQILRDRDRNDLRMLIGRDGYLGISRTDGGFYDFAAALDPGAIRRHGSIAAAIDALLASCGLPRVSSLAPQAWKSTPHLTRRSWPVARDGVFLIGDSMGYVEPFTGEGMSWAMAGAAWLAPRLHASLACQTQESHSPNDMSEIESAWNDWAGNQRRHHQSVCRWVASQVRYPSRTAWVLAGLDWFPRVRNILLRKATQ